MKVGFIVECGPEGAEMEVIPHLALRLIPKLKFDIIALDDKRRLKPECGRWARQLLDSKCDRVLIVWDLMPAWGEYEGRGCRRIDRQEIYESLERAGLRRSDRRIKLICVHKMLEAWILADERALSSFLSTDAHPVRAPRTKKPENVKDPKARLKTLFKERGRRVHDYVDRLHAIQVVRRMPDLARLDQCPTFARFKVKLLGA